MSAKIFRLVASALVACLLFAAPATPPAGAQGFADQATGLFTTTGSANTYAVTIPNVTSYNDTVAVKFTIVPNVSNTNTTTINVNTLGAKNILKPGPAGLTALIGNELITGQPAVIQYDGTEFVLLSSINSTLSNVLVAPQGRLTLTSGVPVQVADVSAATAIYYTPSEAGNQIPIYNGSQMVTYTFTELTLTIPSSRLANTLYDVCVFLNSGTPTVVFSVAWSTSTAGSGARGTGAGTAQIDNSIAGIWTNTVVFTGVNGATSYSNIPAHQCTTVGSVYIDGTNGQLSTAFSYGQSRKLGYQNLYNLRPFVIRAGDSTASWTYNSTTIRESRGQTTNFFTGFWAIAEEPLRITFKQNIASNAPFTNPPIGIGVNSTTVMSTVCFTSPSLAPASAAANYVTFISECSVTPTLGINNYNMLESGASGGTSTFLGAEVNMEMVAWGRF